MCYLQSYSTMFITLSHLYWKVLNFQHCLSE
uniref:Uncharacterized protein n=1 Tax=Anguilla anguilla TaxID=7936 RepID=A0A0E9S8H1_ANGAN